SKVSVGIAAMTRRGPLARTDQADLVVVVERAHGQPTRPGQLPDAPSLALHSFDGRTSVQRHAQRNAVLACPAAVMGFGSSVAGRARGRGSPGSARLRW